MKKRQQHSSPPPHSNAKADYDMLGLKIEIAPKANGVDAPKKQPSRQEKLDQQALERAENEGMESDPPAGKRAAPKDRRPPVSGWHGFRMSLQLPER